MLLTGRMKELAPFAVQNPNNELLPDPELDATDPLKGFGTPEHRKKVEIAAEYVSAWLLSGGSYSLITRVLYGKERRAFYRQDSREDEMKRLAVLVFMLGAGGALSAGAQTVTTLSRPVAVCDRHFCADATGGP